MLRDIAAALVFVIIIAVLVALFVAGIIYPIWPHAVNKADDFASRTFSDFADGAKRLGQLFRKKKR